MADNDKQQPIKSTPPTPPPKPEHLKTVIVNENFTIQPKTNNNNK